MYPPYYLENQDGIVEGEVVEDTIFTDEEFARAAWLRREPVMEYPDEEEPCSH